MKYIDRSDDLTNQFLNTIGMYDNLSAQQERDLIGLVRAGGEEGKIARDTLINHNMRLAVHEAKRYRGLGLELDDLIQEGALGLIEVIERYDPETGRFSTYATIWIRQSIRRAIENKGSIIRIPSYAAAEWHRIKKARAQFMAIGYAASPEEVAEATGLSLDRMIELDRAHRTISLEKDRRHTSEGDDVALVDVLAAPDDIANVVETETLQQEIRDALSMLPKSQRDVIEQRHLAEDGELHSLEEIAQNRPMPVTRERTRQIEKAAFIRLRELSQLRDYFFEGDEGQATVKKRVSAR